MFNVYRPDFLYSELEDKTFYHSCKEFIEDLSMINDIEEKRKFIKDYDMGITYNSRNQSLFSLQINISHIDIRFMLEEKKFRDAFFFNDEKNHNGIEYLWNKDFFENPEKEKFDNFFSIFAHEDVHFKTEMLKIFYDKANEIMEKNYTWILPLIEKYNFNDPEINVNLVNITGKGLLNGDYSNLNNDKNFYKMIKKVYPKKYTMYFLLGSSNEEILKETIDDITTSERISVILNNLKNSSLARNPNVEADLLAKKISIEKEQLLETISPIIDITHAKSRL